VNEKRAAEVAVFFRSIDDRQQISLCVCLEGNTQTLSHIFEPQKFKILV
jgi:hypothetical protein